MKADAPKDTKDVFPRAKLFFEAFRITEVWFKYSSWLLTLGAVKLAADLTHSRLLSLLAIMLTWHFWSPIGCFIVGLPREENLTWSYAGKVLTRFAAICILGYYANGYINELVDAIIKARYTK